MNILEVAFNEEALENLTKLVERFEKVCSILSVSAPNAKKALKKVTADEEESDLANGHDEEADEDFAPKKAKAKAKTFLDEDDEDSASDEMEASSDDEEDKEEEPAPKKEKKKKKLTVDSINDACKERAQRLGGKEGRAEVLGILKKKFKVSSVTELKPDSYAAVISAMRAE